MWRPSFGDPVALQKSPLALGLEKMNRLEDTVVRNATLAKAPK